MKKWVFLTVALIITAGAIAFFQYKPLLENRLEIILEQQGLENVDVKIARIGVGGAVLDELRFGRDEPLLLKNIILKYSLADLKKGRIDEILFENIMVKAQQLDSGWQISGLGALKSESTDENPLSFLNITSEQIERIPFRHFGIQSSEINVDASFGALQMPLNILWGKNKSPNLSYHSDKITFSQDSLEVSALEPIISASFDNGLWSGDWSSKTIATNTALPPLSAQGTLKANHASIETAGDFISDDSVYKGDFILNYTPSVNPSPVLKSNLQIDMPIQNGAVQMPLTVDWVFGEPMRIAGSNGQVRLEQGELALNAGALKLNIIQKDSSFTGTWSSDKISVTAPLPVPLLKGSSNVHVKGAVIDIGGKIESADKSWLVDFALVMGKKEASLNGLRLKRAEVPWNKGRISVRDIWFPFVRQKDMKLDIKVEQVDLAELMSTLTGDRIHAKGLVTGHVPITISPDGGIHVDGGNLGAEGPGTIVMPPETIPANNEQVNLVKDIMQNLQFEVLNISAINDEHGELVINLSVEGKNPKVLEGHPVKLNINLTGNLVEFFEQNLMLLTKPETLLKRKQD